MVMHKKVLERKQNAPPITYSSINITKQAKLNTKLLDEGIVEGYSIIWGQRSLTGLKFIKGCCARSIKEHGPGSNANYEIKFLNQHNPEDPLSLFEWIVEDDTGLKFRTKVLDEFGVEGSSANRVIRQLKSKTLNNFSHGFDFVWDKVEYDDTDDSLVCAEIQLFENSVVTIPAGLNTRRIQSLEEMGDVREDINNFIRTLPAKYRMDARYLFTLQQSLIDDGQILQKETEIKQSKTLVTSGDIIDYKFFNENYNNTKV